jgi:hypothetical protein
MRGRLKDRLKGRVRVCPDVQGSRSTSHSPEGSITVISGERARPLRTS